MRKLFIFLIWGIFITFFISLISASLEINSSNYSGYITQGSSSGNITADNYSGDSASFYQQAVGYLNDLLFSGIHGFSFQVAAPTASIIKPENETYFTGTNLELNFTLDSSVNKIWYKLDSGANTTISGNTTFNTTNGLHTLYLFANDSQEINYKNVVFTVNTTRFTINYNNYAGNGSTTNFNASSYEDIQNLSDIVLEKSGKGKISFNQPINLTNDSNYSNNIIEIDSYINISSNFIDINTTILPNFNKSATLSIYNLAFTNPRILRDGSVCHSEICTEVSYSAGVFIFNVTQFSTYSAEETPTSESGETNTGGGGGGTTTGKFEVIPEELHITLKQGETKEIEMTIRNTGSSLLKGDIAETKLKEFIRINSNSFSLNPGESKIIVLDFLAKEDTNPLLYIGKLIVKADGIEKEIIVVIGVESKGSLFDVEAKIPSGYQKVFPGKDIIADIKVYNFGAKEAVDVKIEYMIKEKENNTITTFSDTVAVETQTSFTKTIPIPENTALGRYILYVTVTYNGKIASSSVSFDVVEPEVSQREKLYIVIIVVLSVIISFTVYLIIIHQRRVHGKISGKKIVQRMDLRKIMRK